jgi:5-methylcytosine-specific restriction endonuclease McrA
MAKKGDIKKNAKPRTLRDRAYDASPARKKARAARNKARREAVADGRARKGDGKDIDHKKPLSRGGSTSKANTRVRSAKSNRSAGGKMNSRAHMVKAGRKGGKS